MFKETKRVGGKNHTIRVADWLYEDGAEAAAARGLSASDVLERELRKEIAKTRKAKA